jgi:hypothetical protein
VTSRVDGQTATSSSAGAAFVRRCQLPAAGDEYRATTTIDDSFRPPSTTAAAAFRLGRALSRRHSNDYAIGWLRSTETLQHCRLAVLPGGASISRRFDAEDPRLTIDESVYLAVLDTNGDLVPGPQGSPGQRSDMFALRTSPSDGRMGNVFSHGEFQGGWGGRGGGTRRNRRLREPHERGRTADLYVGNVTRQPHASASGRSAPAAPVTTAGRRSSRTMTPVVVHGLRVPLGDNPQIHGGLVSPSIRRPHRGSVRRFQAGRAARMRAWRSRRAAEAARFVAGSF